VLFGGGLWGVLAGGEVEGRLTSMPVTLLGVEYQGELVWERVGRD
jgi:hypothetical protein